MSALRSNMMLRMQCRANSERSEPKQLKLDFSYDKQYKNAEETQLSRYDGCVKSSEKETSVGKDRPCVCRSGLDSYFEQMRVFYYGPNWIEVLFPKLN